MADSAINQFDRQLEQVAKPRLEQLGFTSFPQRVFRRNVEHESTLTTQVIDFQIGEKALTGHFTVNLGVYNEELMPAGCCSGKKSPVTADCMFDLTQRLGAFHVVEQSLIARLFRRPKPVPHDYWWDVCDDEAKMGRIMQSATDCLQADGLAWLQSRTTKEAFAWAREELERRKAWKRQLAEPNPIRAYEPMPFPVSR